MKTDPLRPRRNLIARRLASLLRTRAHDRSVVVSSFDHRFLAELHRRAPSITLGALQLPLRDSRRRPSSYRRGFGASWYICSVAQLRARMAEEAINGQSTNLTVLGPASFGTRIESFGGIEGRVGYAFDRLLIFIQGGVPYATTKSYYSAAGFSGSATETRFRIGRQNLVGAGAEYAINDNWSIRADYVYSFVGAWWKSFSPAPGVDIGYMTRTSFHTARASIDYHFDLFAPATPVVAKY